MRRRRAKKSWRTARRTLRPEVVRQKLVESHAVGGFHRQLALQRFAPPPRRTPPAAARSADTGRGNTPCGRRDMRSARSANDSPVERSSSSVRAEGVQLRHRRSSACCSSSAAAYGRCGVAVVQQLADARASNRSARSAHVRNSTGRPSRLSCRPGSRPRCATSAWFASSSCLLGRVDRRARRFSTHSAANASRKRSLFWFTPTGSNALTSSARTSTYSTPPRRSALRRPLAGARDALRTDGAVVLVLDLQQVGVELAVLAVDLHADAARTPDAAC